MQKAISSNWLWYRRRDRASSQPPLGLSAARHRAILSTAPDLTYRPCSARLAKAGLVSPMRSPLLRTAVSLFDLYPIGPSV
jgi:hypothetical protein